MSKILVIEDTPESAQLAERVLGQQDYDVLIAATGKEGLEITRDQKPDVILLDLGLPDVGAEAMAQQLCIACQDEDTPIIVVSAWPEHTVRQITEAFCFKEYIIKPYNVDTFVERVNAYIPT